MGRPRKKPNYDAVTALQDQIKTVAEYYGEPYDDRKLVDKEHVSLRDAAEHFGITILKARKMLITAGVYSTNLSRRIQELSDSGKTCKEIMKLLRLSRASVQSYLPYAKVIYNMPELSVDADRKKLQRVREKECREFVESLHLLTNEQMEADLWHLIVRHEGCIFHTAKDLMFRYKVKGGEIFIDRKKGSITKATVFIAFHAALELDGNVSGPKKLGTFGASYLYPIFVRFGIIKKSEKK